MSDQVGNPEDRFSHNEAQLTESCRENLVFANIYADLKVLFRFQESFLCGSTSYKLNWEKITKKGLLEA